MSIVHDPSPESGGGAVAVLPPSSGDEALDFWRVAHRACVRHLGRCTACGIELCPDGQTLWDAADAAERALPWRTRGEP